METYEEIHRGFVEGRISRRSFIQRATALGMAAAVPSALLLDEAKAAEPKRGGHLRIGSGHGATSDSLDPSQHTSSYITLLIMAQLIALQRWTAKANWCPNWRQVGKLRRTL